jgi:hypothetical protein
MISSVRTAFFERRTALELLDKRFKAFKLGFRQNICVLGPRSVGKSTLMKQASSNSSLEDIIVISFSCQVFDSLDSFVQRWMSETLVSCYELLQKAVPSNFHILFRELKPMIPRTLRKMKEIKRLLRKGRSNQVFRELIALIGLVTKECSKKALLLIDDFDFLEGISVEDPFRILGNEIMEQKETMFVFSGANRKKAYYILGEKLSLLFANFEIIDLKPLTSDESTHFIEERVGNTLLTSDSLKRFLFRLTDGHPFYLATVLKGLAKNGELLGVTEAGRLIRAITDTLFLEQGSLNRYFKVLPYKISGNRPSLIVNDVLFAISLGHKKLSEMTRFLRYRGGDIKRALEQLLSVELIERHGAIHIVVDPMLKFWFSTVYYRNRYFSGRISQLRIESFECEVQNLIEKSHEADLQELPKRVEILLKQFQNNLMDLGERKLRCPCFTEITSKPNNGRIFPLYAKNPDKRWLCQVVVNEVCEDDVQALLLDVRRLRKPVHVKIIIGLRGIDLNAKLLAQEEKIQYLDLDCFNILMHAFDQMKVVF